MLFSASLPNTVNESCVPVVTVFDPMVVRTGGVLLLMVIVTGLEVLVFPATSRAVAVSVWFPFEIPIVFHDPEYGEMVSSLPMLEPSSLNWTPVTPMLSLAVAERVTVPEIVPLGEVRVMVGRVWSGVVVVMGREQEAVVPPLEPAHDQRLLVDVSVVSEKVPVVQVLRVREQEPLVAVGVPVYSYAPMSQVEPRGLPRMSVVKPLEERLAPALISGLPD